MSDHVTSYFIKLDARLRAMPEAQRPISLRLEIQTWERRYQEYQAKIDAGIPVVGVDAYDYVQTIAGLDQRIAQQQAVA